MRVLLWFKGLVWLAYALLYGLVLIPGYARIEFQSDAGDLERARERCAAAAECGARHDVFVSDQVDYLSMVATFLRTSAWAAVALDAIVIVFAVVAASGAARAIGALRVLWPAQLVAAAVTIVGYVALMLVGASKLSGIPDSARVAAFEIAFDSPFLRFGTYYYLAALIGSTALTVGLSAALASAGRRLRAVA